MSKTAFHQKVTYQEKLHEKRVHEFSKEALEQYKEAYSACEEILYDIEDTINLKSDTDRKAIFAILVRVLGTMQSAKWLFLKGYYYDAMILVRSLMESLGTCCYISQNKGTGDRWLKGEKISSYTNLAKTYAKTLNETQPEEVTAKFYSRLSTFTHGEWWAVQTLITAEFYSFEKRQDMIHFNYPLPYDKAMVDTIAGLPLQTLLIIQKLFPEISDYAKRQIAEIQIKQYEAWKRTNS
jgi:hypothetical protein